MPSGPQQQQPVLDTHQGCQALPIRGKTWGRNNNHSEESGTDLQPRTVVMGRATHHGEAQSHPVHLTGLLFLHPEMGAPESVRSTERPSLKSMPFQPGQQKQTSQCDVSKAKNSSPNFSDFIGAATAQVSYRVLGRSLPQDRGQSQGEDTGAT